MQAIPVETSKELLCAVSGFIRHHLLSEHVTRGPGWPGLFWLRKLLLRGTFLVLQPWFVDTLTPSFAMM